MSKSGYSGKTPSWRDQLPESLKQMDAEFKRESRKTMKRAMIGGIIMFILLSVCITYLIYQLSNSTVGKKIDKYMSNTADTTITIHNGKADTLITIHK